MKYKVKKKRIMSKFFYYDFKKTSTIPAPRVSTRECPMRMERDEESQNSFAGDEKDDVISSVSAIANMESGHLVIGVQDTTLKIVGTDLSKFNLNAQSAVWR